MMRKLKFGWAVCALMLSILALFSQNVFAEDELIVFVPGAEVVNGEAHVPVVITKNPGITSIKLSITYDSEQLQLTSCENGSIFESGQMTASKTLDEDPYVVLFIDGLVSDHIGTGSLVMLTFQTTDSFSGMADVTVEISDTVNFDLERVSISDSRIAGTVKGTAGSKWHETSSQEEETVDVTKTTTEAVQTTPDEEDEPKTSNMNAAILIFLACGAALILGMFVVGKKKEDTRKKYTGENNTTDGITKNSTQNTAKNVTGNNPKSAVKKHSGNNAKNAVRKNTGNSTKKNS
jgi:hypothetical protein